jgi:hypothetical protein
MAREFPILEFDPRREAVIEPRPLEATLPRGCVLCFFHEVIDRWRTDGTLRPIAAISTTIGAHPVYGWTHAGQEMALAHPGLTTDAVYRETADKIASRKAEGCLTVEMEAADACARMTDDGGAKQAHV